MSSAEYIGILSSCFWKPIKWDLVDEESGDDVFNSCLPADANIKVSDGGLGHAEVLDLCGS